jgi:hypothetical protein
VLVTSVLLVANAARAKNWCSVRNQRAMQLTRERGKDMKRILLALVAAAAFACTVGTAGSADARPFVRFGVGYGPGYGAYYGRPYGYGGYGGAYRPYYGAYGYRPYVGGYGVYRPYYGGYGYGGGYGRSYYRGGYGGRCW